jgi:hypothetical protein
MKITNKIINLVKREVQNIFENDEKYFNGMLITNNILNGDKPVWEPLYEFLKNIFGDKYKEAADGYMFYGSYIIEDHNNLEVFHYRHGITRKYFFVDKNGQPYKLQFSWISSKRDSELTDIEKISYQEQFKLIYSDLIKSIESACKQNDCEMPEDPYLMGYSDYKVLRDKMLDKLGYKTTTVQSEKDIENFGKELEEDWSNKYKKSINCSNPKGFSQKAHCAARKKRQRGETTKSKSPFKK